jgi:hypothetical protein
MTPEATGRSMPGNELLGRWLASDECKFWLASHPAPQVHDWVALSEKLGIGEDALRAAMQAPQGAKTPFQGDNTRS